MYMYIALAKSELILLALEKGLKMFQLLVDPTLQSRVYQTCEFVNIIFHEIGISVIPCLMSVSSLCEMLSLKTRASWSGLSKLKPSPLSPPPTWLDTGRERVRETTCLASGTQCVLFLSHSSWLPHQGIHTVWTASLLVQLLSQGHT